MHRVTGTWSIGGLVTSCTAWTECVNGTTYESTTPSASADRVCSACTAVCTGSNYQTRACTKLQDRVCSACAAACVNGTSYQATACTSLTNRVCAPCGKCEGAIPTVSTACTALANVVCSAVACGFRARTAKDASISVVGWYEATGDIWTVSDPNFPTLFNQGNAFNQSTGTFTAPRDGFVARVCVCGTS